jgi:hypothetical protein
MPTGASYGRQNKSAQAQDIAHDNPGKILRGFHKDLTPVYAVASRSNPGALPIELETPQHNSKLPWFRSSPDSQLQPQLVSFRRALCWSSSAITKVRATEHTVLQHCARRDLHRL